MLAAFCTCCCLQCSTAPIFSVGTLGNVFFSDSGDYRFALPDFLLPSPDSFAIKPMTDGSSFVYRPFQFSNIDYSPPPSDIDWSRHPGTGQKTNSVYGWSDGSYPDGEPVDPRDVSHSYCVETNQQNSVLLIRRVSSGSSSQFYASILPPVFRLDYRLFTLPKYEYRFAYLKKKTFVESDFKSANYTSMVSQFNSFIRVPNG